MTTAVLLLVAGTANAQLQLSPREVDTAVFTACRDEGLRRQATYAGCSHAEIEAVCTGVEDLTPSSTPTCGVAAIAQWYACHVDVLSTEQRATCDAAAGRDAQPISEDEQVAVIEEHVHAEGATPIGMAIDPSIILVGTTEFFLGRAKAEMLVFFRERLATDLCPTKGGFLPSTCDYLKPGGKALPDDSLVALRTAFRADLEALPTRIADIVRAKARAACEANAGSPLCALTWAPCLLDVGGRVVPLVKKGQLRAALEELEKPPSCPGKLPPWWGELQKLSGRAGDVLKEAERLHAQRNGILMPEDVDLALYALANAGVDDETMARLKDMRSIFVEVFVLFDKLRSSERYDAAFASEFFDTGFRVFVRIADQLACDTAAEEADPNAGCLKRADIDSVRGVFEALNDIVHESYAQAAIRIFENIAINAAFEVSLTDAEKKVLAAIRRHAAFVGSIAAAKTPEDVEAAITAAASPVGSYREYRRREWPGFLAGIVGMGGGFEVLPGAPENGGFASFFLPVGIETGVKIKEASSFNVMLSLVDLGALASARVQNATDGMTGEDGEAKVTQDVSFVDVLAPGVVFSFGLGDSPVAIAFGAQYQPSGREHFVCETSPCGDTDVSQTVRFFAFVGVDMPVYPLW